MQLLHTAWRITAAEELNRFYFSGACAVARNILKPASTHGAIEVACDAAPYVRDFKLFERVLKTVHKLEFAVKLTTGEFDFLS